MHCHAVNMHFTRATCHASVNAITGIVMKGLDGTGKTLYKTPRTTETFSPDITRLCRNKPKTTSIMLTLFDFISTYVTYLDL